MALRSDGLRTKKRILSSCVRLFLEKGYHKTTLRHIYEDAGVSAGSFQNIFHSKDGVLLELVQFMFQNQFSMARNAAGTKLPPVYVYAAETAIQIALIEMNETLREIYIEAYTNKSTLDFIQGATTEELYKIFGPYQKELTKNDFLALDYGSAGLMRGYMVNVCNADFTLEKKIKSFLTLALRGYKVPEEEIQQVLGFILGLDVCTIAQQVMEALFKQIAMHYEFSLKGILPEGEVEN